MDIFLLFLTYFLFIFINILKLNFSIDIFSIFPIEL